MKSMRRLRLEKELDKCREGPRLRESLKNLEIIQEREAVPKPNGIPFFYRGVVVAIF